MQKISLGLAKKIQLLLAGEPIPISQLKSPVIDRMISEGTLQCKLQGRSRQSVFAGNPESLKNYLSNNLGINHIDVYIDNLEKGVSRSENILATTDSKSSSRRTFKGFLVNCITPVLAQIKGEDFILHPPVGSFVYVYDFEKFRVPENVLIVGVENPENFRYIRNQAPLFRAAPTLFVSRYPQSSDLILWLQKVPNQYLHFGDFDFEGIRIFRDEYHKYLGDRASFFIPQNIDGLVGNHGSKKLYNRQYKFQTTFDLGPKISELVALFHRHKKCLEQEVLINFNPERGDPSE